MKQLNVYFEDNEYKEMEKLKESLGSISWRVFILDLTKQGLKAIENIKAKNGERKKDEKSNGNINKKDTRD